MFSRTANRWVIDSCLCLAGFCWLVFLLLPIHSDLKSYVGWERDSVIALRTGKYSDLTQDVIGCRGLWGNTNAYPILGPAMHRLGIEWNVKHSSTHPPTAFLLVSPIAALPVDTGAKVWAWLMIICFAWSFLCLGCGVLRSVGLSFVILAWPPVAASLGQLTAIWLLGICASYRYFSANKILSGAMLALAAATKMAPAIMIVLLLRNKKAMIGFVGVCMIFAGVILIRSPHVVVDYFHVNAREVRQQMGRPDNAALVTRAGKAMGNPGRLLVGAFFAMVIATNSRHIFRGTLTGWSVMAYLAVAVLPILWIYSLAPLLFLGRWTIKKDWMARLFFIGFICMSSTRYAIELPAVLALCVAWLGVGFIVTGLIDRQRSMLSF